MISGLALYLASAAMTPTEYPALEVLQEFERVCLMNAGNEAFGEREVEKRLVTWNESAIRNGWSSFQAQAGRKNEIQYNADYLVTKHNELLDLSLLVQRLSSGSEKIVGSAVFKKRMFGRDFYISTVGIVTGGSGLSQCRLHDFNIASQAVSEPIKKTDIARWRGMPVKRSKVKTGGIIYQWGKEPYQANSMIQIHSSNKNKKPSKYARRGITLMRSDESIIIVT